MTQPNQPIPPEPAMEDPCAICGETYSEHADATNRCPGKNGFWANTVFRAVARPIPDHNPAKPFAEKGCVERLSHPCAVCGRTFGEHSVEEHTGGKTLCPHGKDGWATSEWQPVEPSDPGAGATCKPRRFVLNECGAGEMTKILDTERHLFIAMAWGESQADAEATARTICWLLNTRADSEQSEYITQLKEVSRLKAAKLLDVMADRDSLKEQAVRLTGELQISERERAEACQDRARLTRDIEAYREFFKCNPSNLASETVRLEEENQRLTRERDEKQMQIELLQADINRFTARRDAEKERADRAAKDVAEWQATAKRMDEEHAATMKERDDLRRQLEEAIQSKNTAVNKWVGRLEKAEAEAAKLREALERIIHDGTSFAAIERAIDAASHALVESEHALAPDGEGA